MGLVVDTGMSRRGEGLYRSGLEAEAETVLTIRFAVGFWHVTANI